ncbi:branched-chain amino acid ABC transporter, permease protein [Lachnoanaerobaculum saburreum F0468]|uniref:Branched-chain amino acid ABC transporter, permease protein n=2 Tax=Lachnoanaerobaculum saburreum TaxID=467210 RepID=I0R7F0_9FIRM|nr:branched-chain amino acid ABC transporter permease [Lachnoanaerobaculum saburreum]EFU76179.1 branched-chain amino acid ABC transporter, permease protein [Lachnoanaerobaculum saburreum DSM 3986]EIC95608.1 branched-chain amino acid ABC transporter, permease protein [Lachnoanaerobaculum saburreum F0468]RKW47011.1 MAG: branched-chain amino acid ABC transporter permease [Lachnospiraceae bacterium]
MLINFIEQLINGLRTGSIYALIAIGYTMVYGIAKMINFAHGDIIMVGAYALYFSISVLGLPVPIALLITVIICGVLGVMIEKVAYKPLRSAPPLAVLITAIGMSFFLQSASLLIFGSTPIPFQSVIPNVNISIGPVVISSITVVTLIVTAIAMILLTLFVNKTKLGSAMRAVSEDKGAAELMGINVNSTISMTFAIGSALAAVAGVLYICQYQSMKPTLGALPGIKAFVAAVLGGIGSIPGAMIGGILLGLIESVSKAYISTELADAIVFGVLIVVLLFRPSGLLGKKKIVKV